jgi:hypothetical protein
VAVSIKFYSDDGNSNFSLNHAVKKECNHGWTPMDTDKIPEWPSRMRTATGMRVSGHVSFVPPGRGSWLPFAADVSAAGISFQVGGQSGEIKGPLDTDGVNRIALAPGARLKDLRVEIRDSPK